MRLKYVKDIEALKDAVKKCTGDVILRHNMNNEEFNLKSALSAYVAYARLIEECGDDYEFFCTNRNDEAYLVNFFHQMNEA